MAGVKDGWVSGGERHDVVEEASDVDDENGGRVCGGPGNNDEGNKDENTDVTGTAATTATLTAAAAKNKNTKSARSTRSTRTRVNQTRCH